MIRNPFICVVCMLFFLGCSSDQTKLENFIKDGKSYLEKKEYDKASIQLKNAFELNQESVEVHKLFVKLYIAQQDVQKAFSILLSLEKLSPEDMETKLQIASIYMMNGESGRPKANERIAQVLEKEPDNVKALSLRASMFILERAPIESIAAVYEHILSVEPSNSHAMVMLARLKNKRGEPDQAKILLERALADHPEDFAMYTELYAYYLSNKEHDKAKEVLEKLADKKPADPNPQILIGNFYAMQQQPDMAESAHLKAIELAPDDISAYMALAQFYDRNGQIEKAENAITNAMEKNPEDMALQISYARFLYGHKKFDNALMEVDKILEKKSSSSEAMELKARILLAQKKPESANVILSSLLNEEPGSPVYNYLMASALMDMRKGDLAIAHASKAIKKAPDYFQARFLMADLYYKRGSFSLADVEIKKALKLRPDHYLSALLQGKIYSALDQEEKAEPIYKELIKKNPENPAPYFNLGKLYFAKNDLKSARINYEKALEKNVYLMDVFTNLIRTYSIEQKFQEGINKCNEHLPKVEAHPIVSSIVYNQKGNLFIGMKDHKKAKTAYELSIKTNPQYILPYLSLSRIYKDDNKTDEAINTLEKLIKERPDQAGAFSTIGNLYEIEGKMDQAETYYKKAIEINPSHIQALNNLAFLYADQNREMNRALEFARKARELAGEVPAIMDTLGWVYYRKQLPDAAIQEFASCIQKDPENPLFYYHMGLALKAKNDTEGAKATIKKALDINQDFPGKKDAQKILQALSN